MKTAKEAYKEAYRGINIKKNEKIVLESKDPHYCYWFVRDISRANIKALEEIVLESKDPYYCYWFARDVKKSNKEALFKVILEYGDKDWINNFLEKVDFDKEKYINYLLFI